MSDDFKCPNPKCKYPNFGRAGACACCSELYLMLQERNKLLEKAFPYVKAQASLLKYTNEDGPMKLANEIQKVLDE